MNLKTTSLHQYHLKLGAKMCPFAGYDMPVQYESVKNESLAVREKAGVFDVSHMGEFFVSGPEAIAFVDYLIPNDFAEVPLNKAVYSPLCREDGTMIDDLIAYKLGPEDVLICVNAANIEKDWNWMQPLSKKFNVKFVNSSEEYSLLALQGPLSAKYLKDLKIFSNDDFVYYSAKRKDELIIARTGYTGEDGFEIFGPHKTIVELWTKLIDAGVMPCGLAARDVLRMEVAYPLYGHELNDTLTPFDSGLKWTVKLDKDDFVGKNALVEAKSRFQLVKLSIEKGIPREGYPILNDAGEIIGTVTSGTLSVVLNRGIAIGLVEKKRIPDNKNFYIQIRKNNVKAEFHSKAFVTGGHK